MAYLTILRWRKRAAVRYASLGLVREAMLGRRALRRHVPPLLMLFALATTLVAIARPAAVVALPSHAATVILVIDSSGSMKSDDIAPTRLEAAKAAAKSFILEQPRDTRIGIVQFGSIAALAQAPTHARADLERALDALLADGATALGSGILVALKTVFPDADAQVAPVERGSFKSAAVILLADGEHSAGPDPLAAARLAAERGLRVYTVGFGIGGAEVRPDSGIALPVYFDERMLRTIAELTGGEYLHAGSAAELKEVYRRLNTRTLLEKKYTEITALFCAAAVLAALIGALLSLRSEKF
jgi:Ca-activated chloride channel family protein